MNEFPNAQVEVITKTYVQVIAKKLRPNGRRFFPTTSHSLALYCTVLHSAVLYCSVPALVLICLLFAHSPFVNLPFRVAKQSFFLQHRFTAVLCACLQENLSFNFLKEKAKKTQAPRKQYDSAIQTTRNSYYSKQQQNGSIKLPGNVQCQ